MTTLTYRYKLDPTVLENLRDFAGLHRHAEPAVFREEWDQWVTKNSEMIMVEQRRLSALGCTKDINSKLYKSARYYFKNKSVDEVDATKRREYVGTSKEFREAIDEHITNIARNQVMKPAAAFVNFLENDMYKKIIKTTRCDIQGYGFTSEMIDKKIKKTYKNRYFAHQKA